MATPLRELVGGVFDMLVVHGDDLHFIDVRDRRIVALRGRGPLVRVPAEPALAAGTVLLAATLDRTDEGDTLLTLRTIGGRLLFRWQGEPPAMEDRPFHGALVLRPGPST